MIEQIKNVIKKFFAAQVQHESLVALDFKIITEKNALIQMCFSTLANWSWIFIFGALYLNPFRYQFSLQSMVQSDSRIMMWAYSENFFLGFVILLFLASVINIEILWLTIVAWLISNGEVHILISLGAVSAIFFASARRNLKLISALKDETKKTWMYFSLIQVLSVLVSAAINYILYFNLKNLGYFSSTMAVNRFEVFVLAVFIHQLSQFLFLSIWGHFYSRRLVEPADWKVSYSTAAILPRLILGSKFKQELKNLSKDKIKEKSEYEAMPGIPDRLLKMSKIENESLSTALTYLD